MKRTAAILFTGAAALAAAAPAVAAPPLGANKNADVLTVTCGELTGTVIGTGSAGHVVGATTIGVLKGLTDPATGETTWFAQGFDESNTTACTVAEAPGATFYVLVTPRS